MIRVVCATLTVLTIGVVLVGCTQLDVRQDSRTHATPIDSSAAKTAWLDLSTRVHATEEIVGGDWEISDSNSSECNEGAVHWGLTRLGPGVATAEQAALFDRVEVAWKAYGWLAVRTRIGGDAPGLQLRYPVSGALDDGFYVELGSTAHGSTIGAQTSCAVGDVDQLNLQQFAFNNTPGWTPTPSVSPTALAPTPGAP